MPTPRDMRPRGSERAERNAQKMDRFRDDPGVQQQIEGAHERLRRQYDEDANQGEFRQMEDAPAAPQGPAPPLSQPPMGAPTVPGVTGSGLPPKLTPGPGPRPAVAPRAAVPRGGGSPRGTVHPILPQMRPSMPNPDNPNPLGLSPNSPFRYNKGGMVQKHGSSTCVHSKYKGK
jgi:hypothetical protein